MVDVSTYAVVATHRQTLLFHHQTVERGPHRRLSAQPAAFRLQMCSGDQRISSDSIRAWAYLKKTASSWQGTPGPELGMQYRPSARSSLRRREEQCLHHPRGLDWMLNALTRTKTAGENKPPSCTQARRIATMDRRRVAETVGETLHTSRALFNAIRDVELTL